uniref:Leprecan-like alpha-helical domain-containing protein n=1 Tax=Wuchereria bancrofti TaxID=6293 RepID=A0AAF5PI86_WUCBA
MHHTIYLFILSQLITDAVICTSEEPEVTFEQLYKYGKNEYTNGNWNDCIAFFLRSIEDFDYFIDENVWCREKCARQHKINRQTELKDAGEDIAEIVMMYTNAQHALCLFRCKNDRLTSMRPPVNDPDVLEEFQARKPYQYLQICYWKQKDLASAVRSAYTYLVANPKDQETLDNLAFYMEQNGYNEDMLIDARQMKYEASYIRGVKAYNDEEWQLCVNEFETSVKQFFDEEQKCRHICEDKLNWEAFDSANPEITIIVTSIYLSVLRCKHDCVKKLSRVNGHDIGFILPTYFEYLHVCYYKLNRGRDVCEAVANSILLNPSNPVMRRNRLFYSKTYRSDDLFKPSDEIIEFHKRYAIERLFLEFVDERFKFENNELPAEIVDDRLPLDTTVPINDDFDYSAIEKDLLSEGECSTLAIAAIFETKTTQQKQLLISLTDRVASRYRTQTLYHSLTCSPDTSAPKCPHHALIVSIDRSSCGTFLTDPEANSCVLIFCVG